MTTGSPLSYGKGSRMLTLDELCEWLNITERHARKLVEREAIPYRKIGHLLRFPEAEIDEWSRPSPKPRKRPAVDVPQQRQPKKKRTSSSLALPKSLIE
jgi:excisionase family DNA binding protein